MDWNAYQTFRAQILNGSSPEEYAGSLMMSGVAFDNHTDMSVKGQTRDNVLATFQNDDDDGADFVWLGNGRIRGHFGISSGGHPALAGWQTIYCAGEVHNGYVFFKSGHFHPGQANAIGFMIDMVDTSCQGLAGLARDRMVAAITGFTLQLYRTETATYRTTLDQIAAPAPAPVHVPASPTVSQSMSIGSHSSPVPSSPPRIIAPAPAPLKPLPTTLASGPSRRRQWQPDSANPTCHECTQAFTVTRRRHHCRRCGHVVCDACSQGRKYVRFPANSRNADEENTSRAAVRVCDDCTALTDL